MIFKNHVQWPMTDADRKERAEIVKRLEATIGGRWPVIIKLHPRKIKKVPDSEAPGGYRLESISDYAVTLQWNAPGFVAVTKGNKEVMERETSDSVWVYCDSYIPDVTNKLNNKYEPSFKSIDKGAKSYTQDDLDFLIWMFICYPNLEKGLGEKKSSQNDLVFDLPHLERMAKDQYNQKFAQVLSLIQPPMGRPIEELRKMLTSYFVPGVEEMEDYEVREYLQRKAMEGITDADKIASMDLFINRNNNADALQARYLVQKAIENKMIVFDSKKRSYHMVQDGSPMEQPLYMVAPNETNKEQKLFEIMFQNNKKELELIALYLDDMAKDKKK